MAEGLTLIHRHTRAAEATLGRRVALIIALLASALLTGCAAPPGTEDAPAPPRRTELEARAVRHGAEEAGTSRKGPSAAGEPRGELTLREALSLALLRNPALSAYSSRVRASEARALQAGLLPNPELEGELENFAGSGDVQGFEGAESTIALSQLVELGGKRARRVRVAELGSVVAAWDYEAKRLAVLTETSLAFVDALAKERRLELARRSLEIAEELMGSIRERVEAGASSPLEETRARVAAAQARVAVERARRTFRKARVRLASAWGSTTPRFGSLVGELDQVLPVPPLEGIVRRLSENPDVKRWVAEIAGRRAQVDLARAQAVPDVRVRGGGRLLGGSEDAAFVAGLSLPIPVFDRNQGGLGEARAGVLEAEANRRAAEVRLGAELAAQYEELLSAHVELTTFRDDVVPGAEEVFESVREAHEAGELGYLDVLDAERTLFEVREQYVQALASYHRARVEVEGLAGRSLEDLAPPLEEEGTEP